MTPRLPLVVPVLAVLLGCARGAGTAKPGDTAGADRPERPVDWPDLAVSASEGAVVDPSLDGAGAVPITITLPADGLGPCAVTATLVGPGGEAWAAGGATLEPGASFSVGFDGRVEGVALPPMRLELVARSDCGDGWRGSGAVPLAVVRLAPAAVDLGAVDPADEVPLAFHRADLATAAEAPIFGAEYALGAGGAADGAATVAPWEDPAVPPWAASGDPLAVARNVPAGLVAGAAPAVAVEPARVWAGGGAAVPTGVAVRLVSPVAGDWAAAPAGAVGAALPPTAGQSVLALEWAWEACIDAGGGCTPAPVPGTRETAHTVFRLIGPSTLRDGTAEGFASARPWVGALAATAASVEGADSPEAVMTALQQHLFTDPYLIYDPNASVYSDFEGPYIYWDSITSDLSGWLDRRAGVRLYCHSMSCLLSTLGNTWGADARQVVLGVNFRTKLVRSAGTTGWTTWGFNSHSVATIGDGALLWDAAVEMDGDAAPDEEPITPMAPAALPYAEYLYRLTDDPIGTVNEGRCFVQ